MNPIQAAKDYWVETGLFDEKLMQAAAAYVQANPLVVDRQHFRILTELQEGKPRLGDGETKILLRQRDTAIHRQTHPGPYYLPPSKPTPNPDISRSVLKSIGVRPDNRFRLSCLKRNQEAKRRPDADDRLYAGVVPVSQL